jgi:hypothetical protein
LVFGRHGSWKISLSLLIKCSLHKWNVTLWIKFKQFRSIVFGFPLALAQWQCLKGKMREILKWWAYFPYGKKMCFYV